MINKRDHDELASLYVSHGDRAVRLAYLLTADRDAAEDIANEAFVRLSGRVARLRRPDQIAAYLHRTVVNLCRSYGRTKQRDVQRNRLLPTETTTEMPDVSERDQIWRALLRLPVRQRSALFLRYYEDLSESETADVLNCSIGAAKSLIFRAMEGLRKELKE